MKENISIIFAAMIGTFLIVILPLYSLLDRQDSMSYNVVLTETTKFVDNIRNNGFIDRQSYLEYIAAISSTANTYKVSIEAYKNILVPERDNNGEIVSYVEQKELYNTQDILAVLENEVENQNGESANIKNNVYLLSANDEVYVRVYNTNITTGSVLYTMLSGTSNTKVINIGYGGIVNKVNWELYDKIQAEVTLLPEVVMSVPVNAKNNTNVQLLEENIDCTDENLDFIDLEYFERVCKDGVYVGDKDYNYLYDLSVENNQTIRIAVELRRFETIDTGNGYTKLSDLQKTLFDNVNGAQSAVEQHIIREYIRLNGMYANIDLVLRQKEDFYVFDIILTNVNMSVLDYISTKASVTILPGLGEDKNGMASLMAETVEIELYDENAVNTVAISSPIIWQKLLKTKSLVESMAPKNVVYANEEIAFMISYTGITGKESDEIVNAIKDNLVIHETDAAHLGLEFYDEKKLYEDYEIDIATIRSGHVIVKFSYNSANKSGINYVELPSGWIQIEDDTNIESVEGEPVLIDVVGAKSKQYEVQLDDEGPVRPNILLDGTKGKNEWYTSDVVLTLEPSISDRISREGNIENGGSGVYRNTLSLSGASTLEEKEVTSVTLSDEGTTYAIGKAYDYIGQSYNDATKSYNHIGNVTSTEKITIKIDKTAPTTPLIKINDSNEISEWYDGEIGFTIIPGTDTGSGVDKTTYKIEGSNNLDETEGTVGIIKVQGKSTIVATTYDKAGNTSVARLPISIDASEPPKATIKVIEGNKNPGTEWYYTDVVVQITVENDIDALFGRGTSNFNITGATNLATQYFIDNTITYPITGDGIHKITVNTYTMAGKSATETLEVRIDKSAPNEPNISISGTKGNNDWYISNNSGKNDVKITVNSNGDQGGSGENMITYKLFEEGKQEPTVEKELPSDGAISCVNLEDGRYTLKIYSRDGALNTVQTERTINIDTTAPKSAEFEIAGIEGINGWYKSDVKLSYKGEADETSGIASVRLSEENITENTTGKEIKLTTEDNAGNVSTKTITIKVDKNAPTEPQINIAEAEAQTGGMFGVASYNDFVNVTITPGEDIFLENISNYDKTEYSVETTQGKIQGSIDGANVKFGITQEGLVTIKAITTDKAGNEAETIKTIWINKTTPATPKLLSINGESLEGYTIKTVTSNSSKMSLKIGNLSVGNKVEIKLVNQSTYEKTIITKEAPENGIIEIDLTETGKYGITLTQTNSFGTVSSESTEKYYYNFEQ